MLGPARDNEVTDESSDCSDELGLHGLTFREAAPDEDGVVRDFVWYLVCKACESGSCPDSRRRIE